MGNIMEIMFNSDRLTNRFKLTNDVKKAGFYPAFFDAAE